MFGTLYGGGGEILHKESVRTSQRTQPASVIKFTLLKLCEKKNGGLFRDRYGAHKFTAEKNDKFVVEGLYIYQASLASSRMCHLVSDVTSHKQIAYLHNRRVMKLNSYILKALF